MESVSMKNEGDGVAKVNMDSEKNDCTTLGQSLIKFMSLATGTVKTALQKPANYKKNINHRRYLQKQLKICTRRKKRSTKTKSGSNPKKASPESAGTLATTTDVWMGQEKPRQMYREQMDTRTMQENTFLSYERSFQNAGVFSSLEYSYHDFSNLRNSTSGENGIFASNSAIPEREIQDLSMHMNNTAFLYTDELLPDVLVEADNFLTGEELTRTLDIKDLFVPERNERFDEIDAISYSSSINDENYACNGFQTIPSTTDILSW